MTPIPYTDDVETVPGDESQDIERIIAVMRNLLAQSAAHTKTRDRDVHVKSHGCAVGEMEVLGGLPSIYAQGLFQAPGKYRALARFSNSAPRQQPDLVPDARGLAIQVQQVDGERLPGSESRVQNFVMANHPAFLVSNVREYLRLQEARIHPATAIPALLANGDWDPRGWNWGAIGTLAEVVMQFPSHPAQYIYYSMVPFRYGDWVAKYRVIVDERLTGLTLAWGGAVRHRDALRIALTRTLLQRQLVFWLEVQLRTSTTTMPIEDATVEWPQSESEFVPVARLTLPRQDLGAPAATELEQTPFSVWHGLAAHRPLGGLNRARRRAYEVSAEWRRPISAVHN